MAIAYYYVKTGGTAIGDTIDAADGVYSVKKTGAWSGFGAVTEYFADLKSVTAGLRPPVAGDIIYISDLAATTYSGDIYISYPDNVTVTSVDDTAIDQYKKATTRQYGSNNTSHLLWFLSASTNVMFNGVYIGGGEALIFGDDYSSFTFTDSTIEALVASRKILIGNGPSRDSNTLNLYNSTVNLNATSDGFYIYGGGKLNMQGGSVNTSPVLVSTLGSAAGGFAVFNGVDLSGMGTSAVMLKVSATTSAIRMTMSRCKLPTTYVKMTAAHTNRGVEFDMFGCDVGNGYHYFYHYRWAGISSQDTTTYTNNTEALPVPYSVSMDGTNNSIGNPLRHKLATIPAQNLAESKTFTISLIADTTALTDTNFFIEAVHPHNDTQALGVTVSSRNTDILADGTPLPADTTTSWTGGFANNVPQKVSIPVPALSNVTDGTVELYVNLCNPVSCFVNPVYGVS